MNFINILSSTTKKRKYDAALVTIPLIDLGVNVSYGAGVTVTLKANASVANGVVASYNWSKISGTASPSLSGANTDTLTFTAPGTADTLVYRCTVTDSGGLTASDDVQVSVTVAVSLNLSNLPTNPTTATTASINYSLTGSATVYCRLDAYTPIVAPNPFSLSGLAVGTHQVDYYLDTGSGYSVGSPYTSFSWVINSSGATAIPMLNGLNAATEAPSDADSTGYSTKTATNGGSTPPLSNLLTVTRSSIDRFGPTTLGGLPVIRHHIRSGDPTRNSGHRSELSYDGYRFANGEEVWFTQAYWFDTDFTASGLSGDQMIIQNIHQDATSPSPIGNPFGILVAGGGSNQGINWQVSYQGNDFYLYRTSLVTQQWIAIVTRYRSGFTASGHNPTIEAWVRYGSGSWTKLTELYGGAANQQFGDPLSTTGSNNDWTKIGMYKWTTGTYGAQTTRTLYSSGMYSAKGSNQLANAQSTIASYF